MLQEKKLWFSVVHCYIIKEMEWIKLYKSEPLWLFLINLSGFINFVMLRGDVGLKPQYSTIRGGVRNLFQWMLSFQFYQNFLIWKDFSVSPMASMAQIISKAPKVSLFSLSRDFAWSINFSFPVLESFLVRKVIQYSVFWIHFLVEQNFSMIFGDFAVSRNVF